MELLVCLFLESLAFNQRICFAHQTQTRFPYSRDTNKVHRTQWCIFNLIVVVPGKAAVAWLWTRKSDRRRHRETSISGISTLHPPERDRQRVSHYIYEQQLLLVNLRGEYQVPIDKRRNLNLSIFAAAWKRQRDRRSRRFSVSKKDLTVFGLSIFFLLDISHAGGLMRSPSTFQSSRFWSGDGM
jgi:hypothetical protein